MRFLAMQGTTVSLAKGICLATAILQEPVALVTSAVRSSTAGPSAQAMLTAISGDLLVQLL